MGMMIYVLIYKKSIEHIEGIRKVKVRRYSRVTINRYQMCKTKYSIDVNNSGVSQSILIGIRTYNPHASIRIWAIECWRKPLNKCTREVHALIVKGKEEFDLEGSQSSEAFCTLVNNCKDTVTALPLPTP